MTAVKYIKNQGRLNLVARLQAKAQAQMEVVVMGGWRGVISVRRECFRVATFGIVNGRWFRRMERSSFEDTHGQRRYIEAERCN